MKVYAAVASLFLLILQLILKQKVNGGKRQRKGEGEGERWRQANLDKVKVAKSCKYLVDSIVQLIKN